MHGDGAILRVREVTFNVRLRPILCVIVAAASVSNCTHADPTPKGEVTSSMIADSAQEGFVGSAGDPELSRSMNLKDPPRVSVIREITPAESEQVYTRCLQEAGWKQTSQSGVEPYYDVPAEQEESFNLARYICYSQYPVAEKYTRPLTEDQLGILYDHWTSTTIACLEDLGYDVGDVPTRENFLADPKASWLRGPRTSRHPRVRRSMA
jgi:hypothetical protein